MKKLIGSIFALLLVLVATPVAAQEEASVKAKTAVSGFIETVTAVTEPFRIKYAAQFTAKRDEVKARIGIQVSKQVGQVVEDKIKNSLAPDAAGTKAQQADIPEQSDTQQFGTLDNPWDYVTLFWTSALAAMFNNATVFYISTILLTLLLLRFIITRFASTPAA